MDQTYTLAVKNWILSGKDGYTAFLDESIIKEDPMESPTIQEIFTNWLEVFAKSEEELQKLQGKRRQVFEQRLQMF